MFNVHTETIFLLGISHQLIPNDKVADIIASAMDSVGVPLVGLERNALMAIADDAYRVHRAFITAQKWWTNLRRNGSRVPIEARSILVLFT
jgi:hypothetical protein